MKKKIQNKKIYSKPLLEVMQLDHEISLVMMTGPPGNGGDPGIEKTSALQNHILHRGPAQVSSTSADNDPFGGSGPQY